MSNPATTPARQQAKAIIGGLLAGLTALGTALADGAVSPVEVVGIAVALLATYGTVFGVSNGPTYARNEGGWAVFPVSARTAGRISRANLKRKIGDPFDERGESALTVALIVLVVVVVLLLLVPGLR